MKIIGKEVSRPGGICESCFSDPTVTHEASAGSSIVVSYCEHNQMGGFIQMNLSPHRWTLYTPVKRTAWRWYIESDICDAIEADHMHAFDRCPKFDEFGQLITMSEFEHYKHVRELRKRFYETGET